MLAVSSLSPALGPCPAHGTQTIPSKTGGEAQSRVPSALYALGNVAVDYRAPGLLECCVPNGGRNRACLTPAQIQNLIDWHGSGDWQTAHRLKAGEVTSYGSKSSIRNITCYGWAVRVGQRRAYTATMKKVDYLVKAAGGLEPAKAAVRAWASGAGRRGC